MSKEIDALIAEHVFGWPCVHDVQPVPAAVLLADARAEFKEQFGAEPPPKWRPTKKSKYCSCPTTSDRGGVWCVKCGKRGDIEWLPSYEYTSDSIWKIVEKLSPQHPFELADIGSLNPEASFPRWEARFGDAKAEADTVGEAVCMAALRAVGAEVPALDV